MITIKSLFDFYYRGVRPKTFGPVSRRVELRYNVTRGTLLSVLNTNKGVGVLYITFIQYKLLTTLGM